MISRRSAVKLIAAIAIVVIGAVYWYYAEKHSSPIEEVEKTVETQE